MDNIVNKVLPFVDKFQSNIYVSSLMEGMMNAMPVIIAGVVFQVIYSFPIPAWQEFLMSIGLYELLGTVVTICNMSALFFVFAIGRAIGIKKGIDGFTTGMASLLSFLIITPLTVNEAGSTAIETGWFSAQGIFAAIIVAMTAASLYALCINKKIVITMPDSVPAFVSKSFEGIPAALITIVPFVIVRGIFGATSYGSFSQFIYATLQAPLVGLGNSFPAHLIAVLVTCILWWFGIHGTLVTFSVMMAVWQPPMIENIAAAAAGEPIPYVLSYVTIFYILHMFGGPGALFGLSIDMALFSKSERFKAQSKLALVTNGVFNIIEPNIFGIPIVLNPVLLIPYLGLPIILYVAYYLLASAGIVGIPTIHIPFITPAPIGGFLVGGGVSLGIFTLLGLVLSCVVYYPFLKILDAQALKKEQEAKELEEAAAA
jgi:PTS system cellobiose-specific IIC component